MKGDEEEMSVVMAGMERKVTKIGNSLGVTMTEALKRLDIVCGDTVKVDVRDNEIVIKKSQYVTLPEGISSDFLDTLHAVMNEYDGTLKGLINR